MSISREMSRIRDLEKLESLLKEEIDYFFDPVFGELDPEVFNILDRILGRLGYYVESGKR